MRNFSYCSMAKIRLGMGLVSRRARAWGGETACKAAATGSAVLWGMWGPTFCPLMGVKEHVAHHDAAQNPTFPTGSLFVFFPQKKPEHEWEAGLESWHMVNALLWLRVDRTGPWTPVCLPWDLMAPGINAGVSACPIPRDSPWPWPLCPSPCPSPLSSGSSSYSGGETLGMFLSSPSCQPSSGLSSEWPECGQWGKNGCSWGWGAAMASPCSQAQGTLTCT